MTRLIINSISCLIINRILYSCLQLRNKKDTDINISFTLFICLISIITACINLIESPIINLCGTIFGYLLMKNLFFHKSIFEDLTYDIIVIITIVFIDSICFFLSGLIYTQHNSLIYFRVLGSSAILIFMSKILISFFQHNNIKKIPLLEFVLFIFITIFTLTFIYLFSISYNILNNKFKLISFSLTIGLILLNMIVFHYLEYISKTYDLSEQMLYEKQKLELMRCHYLDIKEQNVKTRKMVHDFKNYINTLNIAYSEGKLELAKKINNQFQSYCSSIKLQFFSENEILDIILNEKYKIAQKENIQFKCVIEDLNISWIKEIDIITIFGNLLDNAIEACKSMEKEKNKFIELKLYKVHSMIVLSLKNSCNNTLKLHNNKIVSTKKEHSGFGISNIKNTLKKYDGEFNISICNQQCNILICLENPIH